MRWIFAAVILAATSFGLTANVHADKGDAPSCDTIVKACKKAGFSPKGKEGTVLAVDCVRPIMLGATVANAGLPLPEIDPALLAACRTEKPGFGGVKEQGPDVTAADGPARSQPAPIAAARPPPPGAPNIIFILTDDLSSDLLAYMPNVQAMQSGGISFENYFLTNSACCPSRASIFTGQFPHNHGVLTNWAPDGGYDVFNARGNESQTFAVALSRAGYRTGLLGKYLNVYDPVVHPPAPGWTEWAVGGRTAYDGFSYALNQNGQIVRYGKKDYDYVTDVLSGIAQKFVADSAASPFFLEIATFAPHTPYSPAPRDAELFPGLKAPRNPAFAARPDANAPAWIRRLQPLGADVIAQIDHNYRMRAQSVQAVDKLIGDIRSQLVALGIAENTYIIFSSDNGYHMGDYSLGEGKMTPFDVDTKVPLVVVGPGVTKGHVESSFVENIDLAPTFVELGHADALAHADGKSIVPLLRGLPPEEWRRTAMIEHVQRSGPIDPDDPERLPANTWDPPTYQALRSKSALYVEYENGGISLYDLVTDPYQLRNIAGSASVADLARYRAAVATVRSCKGSEACWSAQFSDPATATPADASASAAD